LHFRRLGALPRWPSPMRPNGIRSSAVGSVSQVSRIARSVLGLPSGRSLVVFASVVRGLGSVTGGGGSGSGVPAVGMGLHCPLCRALTRLTAVADGSMASHRAHPKGCRTVFFVTPCRPATSVGFSTTGGSNLRPASHECVDSSRPTPHLATDSTPTDCSDECREPSTNSSSLIT